MNQHRKKVAVLAVLMCALLVLSGCPASTAAKLATASSAIASGLRNTQDAVQIGLNRQQISQADAQAINNGLAKVATAGLSLDQAIRADQSAASVSAQANVFLAAFNDLVQNGTARIQNPELKLAVATALNGAQVSIAIVFSIVGGAK